MHLHEHQAKRLFADHGIPVPAGRVLDDHASAARIAGELGGNAWVVKAQVHAGGRGKGGGVRLVSSIEALEHAVGELLGSRLVTRQTGTQGLPVNSVLVEQTVALAHEY